MLKIKTRKQFEKDYKKIRKQGMPVREMWDIVRKLQRREKLPLRNRDHGLLNDGIFKNVRECHIRPDWVLVYAIQEEELILLLLRTGSHSEILE